MLIKERIDAEKKRKAQSFFNIHSLHDMLKVRLSFNPRIWELWSGREFGVSNGILHSDIQWYHNSLEKAYAKKIKNLFYGRRVRLKWYRSQIWPNPDCSSRKIRLCNSYKFKTIFFPYLCFIAVRGYSSAVPAQYHGGPCGRSDGVRATDRGVHQHRQSQCQSDTDTGG